MPSLLLGRFDEGRAIYCALKGEVFSGVLGEHGTFASGIGVD